MSKYVLYMMLVISALFINSCTNTLDGVGTDIKKAGEKIEDTF